MIESLVDCGKRSPGFPLSTRAIALFPELDRVVVRPPSKADDDYEAGVSDNSLDTSRVEISIEDEPAYPGSRPLGSATAWWRERSLSRLAANLASYNVPLYRLNGEGRKDRARVAV